LIEGHRYGKDEYDRTRMEKKTSQYCDELDERNPRKIEMLALFGFFTQQILLFTQRTYTYIGKIDNEQQLRIAVTRSIEVNI
jgi:hypothetical protein